MSNNKQMLQDLTQEQVEQVAGGEGEILSTYLSLRSEDTKTGGGGTQNA